MQPLSHVLALLLGLLAGEDGAPKPRPEKAPQLRSELLRRTKADQDARHAMMRWMKERGPKSGESVPPGSPGKAEFDKLAAKVHLADEGNTKWLKCVVEQHGWPTRTLVGEDGASAAWLLVQHADANPMFQRQCLDLMSKLPKDEVSQSHLAYLTDRVLLAEGKK